MATSKNDSDETRRSLLLVLLPVVVRLKKDRVLRWTVYAVLFALLLIALILKAPYALIVTAFALLLVYHFTLEDPLTIFRGYYNVGVEELRSANYPKSIQIFDGLISLTPDQSVYFVNRGIGKHELRQYEAAIADLDQALALGSTDWMSRYYRAKSKLSLGRYEESVEDLNEALSLKPNNVESLAIRSIVYGALKRYELAIADIETAISTFPKPIFFAFRGVYKTGLNDFVSALDDLNYSLEKHRKFQNKNSPRKIAYSLSNRAVVYYRMGDYSLALTDLTDAINLFDGDGEAFYNLACNYKQLGEWGLMEANLAKSIQLDEHYRDLALKDEDFADIHDMPEFQRAVALKPI